MKIIWIIIIIILLVSYLTLICRSIYKDITIMIKLYKPSKLKEEVEHDVIT
jgi:hypothetical protein